MTVGSLRLTLFFFVLCTLCYQILRIVHFWFPLRCTLTFISMESISFSVDWSVIFRYLKDLHSDICNNSGTSEHNKTSRDFSSENNIFLLEGWWRHINTFLIGLWNTIQPDNSVQTVNYLYISMYFIDFFGEICLKRNKNYNKYFNNNRTRCIWYVNIILYYFNL